MRKTGTASARHPRAKWPMRHLRAWEAAFAAGGLFDLPGAASRWRPASSRKTCLGYDAWLRWRRTRKDADAA
jgi:hypothetical protein